MPQQTRQLPLSTRLYLEPALYELARFVNYGGRRHEDVKAFMAAHEKKHGTRAMWALHELTMTDVKSGLTVLSLPARNACRVLLGTPPESPEYADYWKSRNREPPPEHQPPGDEKPKQEEPEPATQPFTGGISPESYAARAAEMNRRQLLCMLRDARQKLDHHGKRSFSGKEARKEIEAALAELAKRGIEPPPAGEETAEWDKPKSPDQQPARKRSRRKKKGEPCDDHAPEEAEGPSQAEAATRSEGAPRQASPASGEGAGPSG